jgi:hypothetical protein
MRSRCKKACCALGEQDAILGHVASRGDRYPRTPNKTPGGGGVNPLRVREAPLDDDLLKEGSDLSSNVKAVKVVDDDGMSVGVCLAVQMRMIDE